MLTSIAAVLMSFFLPAGAEAYLSERSVYVAYQQADVTFSIFDEALATQAQDEFRVALERPEAARAGVVVSAIAEAVVAGRGAVAVDYSKPAAAAKLNADGDVVVMQGVERTRQTYVDLGAQHLVLTVWTKVDGVDVAATSDGLIAAFLSGGGEALDLPAFLVGGVPIEAFAETLTSDVLGAPVRVDVSVDQ